MAAKRSVPRIPSGLGSAGKRTWKAITGAVEGGWNLDTRDLHLLERACRCSDEIALLEKAIDDDGVTVRGSRGQPVVNRALEEVRMMRLTELRLLAAVEIRDPAAGKSAASRRGAKAAESRWNDTPRKLKAV